MAEAHTYTLATIPSGSAFPVTCARDGDPTQRCTGPARYRAGRSDGRSLLLCTDHAARFAGLHTLPFPVPHAPAA